MTTIEDATLGKRVVYTAVRGFFNSWLYISTSRVFGAATRPDIVKSYPCRPDLFATRIYKPADSTSDKHPVLLLLHGGGFIVNNPSKEDALARHLADNAKCLVASLDYSKSPQNRFPTAYEDVVEVALAVINDPDLSIDKSKVIIGGNSAGGNLALACCQDPRLRPDILGVIGLYPVCDATTFCEAKMASRPDASVPDILDSSYDDLVKMYIGPQSNFDLADPRLSPGLFRKREDLPRHVYLIGVEHDLLAAEARAMAERLAESEGAEKREMPNGWQVGGVRWEMIMGQYHGFDQFGNGRAKEARRLEQKEELYGSLVGWLEGLFRG